VARKVAGTRSRGASTTMSISSKEHTFATDPRAVEIELAKLGIANISTINIDGSVDVDGDVSIPTEYTKIPVQFRNVSGNFVCTSCKIHSLLGSPLHVGGSFACSYTHITSFKHAPCVVGLDFSCSNTRISSLQYAPTIVGGYVWCDGTSSLISLRGIDDTHRNWVIGEELMVPSHCAHLIGLSSIRGVKYVRIGKSVAQPVSIIHDPFMWQEKLLDLGFVEQAQL
jgi:hypothetical protein